VTGVDRVNGYYAIDLHLPRQWRRVGIRGCRASKSVTSAQEHSKHHQDTGLPTGLLTGASTRPDRLSRPTKAYRTAKARARGVISVNYAKISRHSHLLLSRATEVRQHQAPCAKNEDAIALALVAIRTAVSGRQPLLTSRIVAGILVVCINIRS